MTTYPTKCSMCPQRATKWAKPAGFKSWIAWCSNACRSKWLRSQ